MCPFSELSSLSYWAWESRKQILSIEIIILTQIIFWSKQFIIATKVLQRFRLTIDKNNWGEGLQFIPKFQSFPQTPSRKKLHCSFRFSIFAEKSKVSTWKLSILDFNDVDFLKKHLRKNVENRISEQFMVRGGCPHTSLENSCLRRSQYLPRLW